MILFFRYQQNYQLKLCSVRETLQIQILSVQRVVENRPHTYEDGCDLKPTQAPTPVAQQKEKPKAKTENEVTSEEVPRERTNPEAPKPSGATGGSSSSSSGGQEVPRERTNADAEGFWRSHTGKDSFQDKAKGYLRS